MAELFTQRGILLAIGVLILLIGILFLVAIISKFGVDPYFYITSRNVENLRDVMNKACSSSAFDTPQYISFSMPQKTPLFTTLFTTPSALLTREFGDPQYVLYYEEFPAGDAIGWETYYNSFNQRVLATIPESMVNNNGGKLNTQQITDYAKDVKKQIEEKPFIPAKYPTGLAVDMVVLRNLILYGQVYRADYTTGGAADNTKSSGTTSEDISKSFFSFGEWKKLDPTTKEPLSGDNYFEFSNYNSLPDVEKSMIKYMPCGDHALCLKTLSGVYRYDLNSCRSSDIKYVAFVYDDRSVTQGYVSAFGGTVGAASVIYFAGGPILTAGSAVFRAAGLIAANVPGGTLIVGAAAGGAAAVTTWSVSKVAHYFAGTLLTYKISDFNIASPCSVENMEIKKVDCADLEDSLISSYYSCTRMEKIPLMKYGNAGITLDGNYHYTCIEKANKDVDDPEKNNNNDIFSIKSMTGQQCLEVRVTKVPSGFCWTSDAYKDTPVNLYSPVNLYNQAGTQAIARTLGLTPIRASTSFAYIDGNNVNSNSPSDAMILMPYSPTGLLAGPGKKISWGWPADKSDESVFTDIFGAFRAVANP